MSLLTSSMLKIWGKLIKLIRKIAEDLKSKDLKVYLNDPRLDPVLMEMILSFETRGEDFMTSAYWRELNYKNINQLLEKSFENFKQTVALNYFTWLLEKNDPQVQFLIDNLPKTLLAKLKKRAKKYPKHLLFTSAQSKFFNFVTLMLWEYAKKQKAGKILKSLEEPLLGNPPAIRINNKWISQDLANSVLEYQSLEEGIKDFNKIKTVLEIGAGYGRTAYTILSLHPKTRYIIVDIPPALYICQRYLTQVFPQKKIFKFRDFENFSQVKKKLLDSNIAFLMPFQIKKLPDRIIDLFLAIDCLHEMRPKQIDFYFKEINRLAKSFYFKCWKKTIIPYDKILLKEKDYPVFAHWDKIFWRDCKVQSTFFEAFFLC